MNMEIISKGIELFLDAEKGKIASLRLSGKEIAVGDIPIFRVRMRDEKGNKYLLSPCDAKISSASNGQLCFTEFDGDFSALKVSVCACEGDGIEWSVAITDVPSGYAAEWIDFPMLRLPHLKDNFEGGGSILFPYNEGGLVTDTAKRERWYFRHMEPEYPSHGSYSMFPNMICSQFLAYLFDDKGLYIGVHDPARAVKGIGFYPDDEGVNVQLRLFTGVDYGESYLPEFKIVWKACGGNWESAADIYRNWFENTLPPKVKRVSSNKALPEWYTESPVVVTYPVRGIHDMDEMKPNALFPYVNAMPTLNKIKAATGARIMALLMHWEGTAPWAPPYVWPPYGGEEVFNEFRDALHENGDLLGVYCSGFGYTLQSNLIESYNNEKRIKSEGLLKAMCHSPANVPEISRICPGQRSGYDVCPACEKGKEILMDAYMPLFKSGIDYAQILDQNHGGGQYFCYARDHGHPAMPGAWMTDNMQKMLSSWNAEAPKMLFGCESAAAEPFIGNLAMSDNRFELNYCNGRPVPLYAYLYHEYVRNFMGNQVCCVLTTKIDTLRYRLAYSFSIGDIMTLILSPNGKLMTHWGTRDFDNCPDMDKALTLIGNLTAFYNREGREYLACGRMSDCSAFSCKEIEIPLEKGDDVARLPELLASCWEAKDGKKAYIVVNPETEPRDFRIGDQNYTVKALDAALIVI